MLQEQKKSRTKGLEDFCNQIKSSKTEFNHKKRINFEYKRSGFTQGSLKRIGSENQLSSTSSGGGGSQFIPRLESRHFRNKESNVWLNMFETIS